MDFTIYDDAREFARDAEPLISSDKLSNNFTYKNISAGGSLLILLSDDGGPALAATRSPGYAMFLYAREGLNSDLGAVRFFLNELNDNAVDLHSFMAERSLASAIADCARYCRRTKSLVQYRMDQTENLPKKRGLFRRVTENDMSFLPYWVADFDLSCGYGDFDLDRGAGSAEKLIGGDAGYILEDAGMPVSMAVNARRIPGVSIINTVYTPPFFRGRGAATNCVARLAQDIISKGDAAALYASENNAAANHVYRKIGFKPVSLVDAYELY